MKRFTFLFLVAMLAACNGNGLPEGVLDKEAMVSFLSEAYQLEAYNTIMYKGRSTDMAPEVRTAYDDLLQRNGLTSEKVEKSLEYYSNHPREYKEILEEVNRSLAN